MQNGSSVRLHGLVAVGGLVLAFTPNLPRVELAPDVLFLIFVPPLLYWGAVSFPLRDFWHEVSRTDLMFDFYSPLNQWIQALNLPPEYHPFHAAIHFFTHVLPPTLLNPFNVNPLRAVLSKLIDFERLNQSAEAPQLFLNATNIRTGKIKVFETPRIGIDAVLAKGLAKQARQRFASAAEFAGALDAAVRGA